MFNLKKIPPIPIKHFANGGPVLATKIEPIHPYRDGKSVQEEVIGRRVTVTLPGLGYEQLEVKVDDPTDCLTPLLAKATYEKPVYVDFDNFDAHIWSHFNKESKNWEYLLTVKATAVRVVSGPSDAFDIE